MKSRRHVNSDVDMADSRQAAIVVLRTRLRVGCCLSGIMALAEAGPVLATVDQADIRGLVTTRLLYVAELLRSRLEYSAAHTTHNVIEDSPAVVAPRPLP